MVLTTLPGWIWHVLIDICKYDKREDQWRIRVSQWTPSNYPAMHKLMESQVEAFTSNVSNNNGPFLMGQCCKTLTFGHKILEASRACRHFGDSSWRYR